MELSIEQILHFLNTKVAHKLDYMQLVTIESIQCNNSSLSASTKSLQLEQQGDNDKKGSQSSPKSFLYSNMWYTLHKYTIPDK